MAESQSPADSSDGHLVKPVKLSDLEKLLTVQEGAAMERESNQRQ
jgi:hypothetical protein